MAPDEERVLDRYLEEARAHSFAPPDEFALIDRASSGDTEARRTLVTAYLGSAADIGLRLAPPGVSRFKAVQEANLVLLRLVCEPGPKVTERLEPAIREHFSALS